MTSHAKCLITRKNVQFLAIPAGFRSFTKDKVFLGQLPKRLVIGMIQNSAFAGEVTTVPYIFSQFNIN